ncbi:MAG: hypothetical protein ACE5IZ_01930 [Dehalococcoidia bacterium]
MKDFIASFAWTAVPTVGLGILSTTGLYYVWLYYVWFLAVGYCLVTVLVAVAIGLAGKGAAFAGSVVGIVVGVIALITTGSAILWSMPD